jgi:hypothetical protein
MPAFRSQIGGKSVAKLAVGLSGTPLRHISARLVRVPKRFYDRERVLMGTGQKQFLAKLGGVRDKLVENRFRDS